MSTVLSSDCFLVQAPLTSADGVIFGRSAHPSDDASAGVEVLYFPSQPDAPATQKCSAVEVAGAASFAVIVNRPAGVVWGADFGANEKKVAVGVSWSEEPHVDGVERLSATDLTRLALERSASVDEAIATITELVEKHNSDDVSVKQCFVICAEKQLWLLNVVGKLWAAEQVTEGFRQIGNGLSIGTNITRSSDGLQTKAQDLALWNGTDPFDFSQVFHPTESAASGATTPTEAEPFGISEMFAVLRAAANKSTGACQVYEISVDVERPMPVTCHWFTATPDPTESVFKPFVFTRNVRISPLTQLPGDEPDTDVTRLHKLHQQRNWSKVGLLLESLETSCVKEVHLFLSSVNSGSQELDELLKDCVEAEVKFYR